jgi:hypothetical protein
LPSVYTYPSNEREGYCMATAKVTPVASELTLFTIQLTCALGARGGQRSITDILF